MCLRTSHKILLATNRFEIDAIVQIECENDLTELLEYLVLANLRETKISLRSLDRKRMYVVLKGLVE
jgi:hypothetical protein